MSPGEHSGATRIGSLRCASTKRSNYDMRFPLFATCLVSVFD